MANPTIVPFDGFVPDDDARALKEAFRLSGADAQAIINIVVYRTIEQRLLIAEKFKSMYKKDLLKEFKNELRGNFQEIILTLMMPYYELQAKYINKGLNGFGLHKETMIEIFSIHNNHDVVKIVEAYERVYERNFETDIIGKFSDTVKQLIIALSKGNRDESDEINAEEAVKDAQTLLRTGELIDTPEESTFNAILSQRNRKQLQLIFDEYEKLAGHPFEKCIEKEFTGFSMSALLDYIQSIRNPTEYLATRLFESMKSKFGFDDKRVIRIIVGRSEIDLGDIKTAYQLKYGKSLAQNIDEDMIGDYRTCLLAIIGE